MDVTIYNQVINQAKRLHDQRFIQKNSKDKKKIWNIINSKLGKNLKTQNKISYLVDENNAKVTEAKNIAETMNTFFTNVGKNLANSIQQPINSSLILPPMNSQSIFINFTDKEEVTKVINQLKIKKGGVDGIHSKVLIALVDFISQPLTHILNQCIAHSVWPNCLKKAEVIPIHKANEKFSPSNYRPISLISNIAKIFEKIISNRILNFVHKHKLLSKKQFGFLKKIGTSDALNFLTNLLYDKLDKSTPIAVTFLDLAKAFDTVDHSILINKLFNYGIRGCALELIKDYLNNRYQCVKINGVVSGYQLINTGVPQGTILGPLLFILYINDLLSQLPNETIISFADDTAVIAIEKSWSLVKQKMNQNLNIISNWLKCNKLSLNINKTEVITFGNYSNSVPLTFTISINEQIINRVEYTKYLGIIIDYRLTWEKHIEKIINKTKYLIFILYKLTNIMSYESLMMIYYAFFHSAVNYGSIAWGGAYNNNLQILQRMQNRLLKIIEKNKFITLKTTPNLIQNFEINSLLHHYDKLSTEYSLSNSVTRNKSLTLPKRYKTVSSKNSYVKAMVLFNALPKELKAIKSVSIRKKKIKKWILDT